MDISGPSPLIPFLVVATLAFLLHGKSVFEDISVVAELDDATYTLFLIIPLLLLLLVYFTTQSIIIPIALMLIIYAVSKMFLGPLLLILIIYVFSVYVPSSVFKDSFHQGGGGGGGAAYHNDHHGGGGGSDYNDCGWGWAVLIVSFLGLSFMFSIELDQWGLVLVAVVLFVLYNFQSLC